jgi:hypothetical protein
MGCVERYHNRASFVSRVDPEAPDVQLVEIRRLRFSDASDYYIAGADTPAAVAHFCLHYLLDLELIPIEVAQNVASWLGPLPQSQTPPWVGVEAHPVAVAVPPVFAAMPPPPAAAAPAPIMIAPPAPTPAAVLADALATAPPPVTPESDVFAAVAAATAPKRGRPPRRTDGPSPISLVPSSFGDMVATMPDDPDPDGAA